MIRAASSSAVRALARTVVLLLALGLAGCAAPTPPRADAAAGIALNNRGHALAQQGRHAEAVPLYREALSRLPADDAAGARNRASTLNNLGASLAALGATAEAMQAFTQALQLREDVLGPQAPPTLLSRHNLGIALARLGRPREACAQALPAWRGRVQVLGADHPDTLASRQSVESLPDCR
ncbi:hypothetical protein A8M77_11980 [Variovorax sp. JS1663]|nr:hypothetical protein A8M77_11980 [Variovorax sp. JS1663]